MGYISIGEKENALRCADTLEAIAQQNPTKKEEIMVDVAYIKLQAGDHKGAAMLTKKVTCIRWRNFSKEAG